MNTVRELKHWAYEHCLRGLSHSAYEHCLWGCHTQLMNTIRGCHTQLSNTVRDLSHWVYEHCLWGCHTELTNTVFGAVTLSLRTLLGGCHTEFGNIVLGGCHIGLRNIVLEGLRTLSKGTVKLSLRRLSYGAVTLTDRTNIVFGGLSHWGALYQVGSRTKLIITSWAKEQAKRLGSNFQGIIRINLHWQRTPRSCPSEALWITEIYQITIMFRRSEVKIQQ